MNTYINDFSVFVKWTTEKLQDIIDSMINNSEFISNKEYELTIYDNYGEYEEAASKYNNNDNKTPILIAVRNNGGSIDITSGKDIYIQSIGLEVLSPLENKSDISKIINTFILENSRANITIDNMYGKLQITDLPDYSSEITPFDAKETFTISTTFNILLFTNSMLSDGVEFIINGIKVPVSKFSFVNTKETKADNSFGYSDGIVRSMSNVGITTLAIDYYYDPTNPIIAELDSSCWTNSNLRTVYSIEIKYNGETKNTLDTICKLTTIGGSVGSLISEHSEFILSSKFNSNIKEK